MRLHFPNKEHDDMLVAHGETSIGAASDNSLVLDRPGISPHHASISVGDRGYVLSVIDPNARAHVNARPVREKAILRLGDVVSLDTLQFMLKPDRDASIRTDVPATAPTPRPPGDAETRTRGLPPKAVLRGVSGSYFGKIVPLRGRLVIGRGSDCDLVLDEPEMSRRHAVIENSGDGMYLRDLGSANGTFVNGVQVRDAVLHPDDQIAFDQNRFLVEAPGMPSREQAGSVSEHNAPNITQTMRAVRLPEDDQPRKAAAANSTRNDIWWLIGAAALIGMGIALLLLVKF
ncbi:MAG TPA: FHA domain-containing protein [Rhodanobacteraceae bacterium]|jgi:pSer/pThr/pTyr-binding forkhead associated (FHA) protein|nr:FHA domain-containing protein [Rhodanobacteraceae bacterium]